MHTMAHAQERNDPWLHLQNHLAKNKPFIASEITSRYELPGDDSPTRGTYRTIIQEPSNETEPTRTLSPITKEGELGLKMAAMNFGIAEKFANHPAELFTPYSSVEVLGQENRKGTELIVLQLRSRFSKKGNFPLTAKIWMTGDNHPVQVEGTIENVPLPGVKNVSFTINYADDENGNSLPKDVVVSYPIKIFIHSGTVLFHHTLSAWQTKAVCHGCPSQ